MSWLGALGDKCSCEGTDLTEQLLVDDVNFQ
jgi:hypothetical protein